MKGYCSPKPVDVFRKNPPYRKICLDSTYFGLKAMRQVPLYLSDLEMNWTSSFLVQSDKLAGRSALASRSCRYSGEASRVRSCSSSKSDSGSGVAMLSAVSLVDAVIDWVEGQV